MMEIRQATTEDTQPLLNLLEDARHFKESLGDYAWGAEPFASEEVLQRIKSGNTYIAFIGGALAGSVMLLWEDERHWRQTGLDCKAGYIHGLAVSSSFRGQKIGEQIIEWVDQQVSSREREFIRLDCPVDNVNLCSYYESLGFNKVNTSDNEALYQRPV